MIKLYGMTVLALVCASSSISVDAKGVVQQGETHHPYAAHDGQRRYGNGETGEPVGLVVPSAAAPASPIPLTQPSVM